MSRGGTSEPRSAKATEKEQTLEPNASRAPIVLDKSFLRGAPRTQLAMLAAKYEVLVPSALIFEILTTSSWWDRLQCADRLIRDVGDFRLVEHPGALLRREIAERTPSTPLVDRSSAPIARLGPRLAHPRLVLRVPEILGIQDWRADIATAADDFVDEVGTIPELFQQLSAVREDQRKQAAIELQANLANDPEPVKRLHGAIRREQDPTADEIGPDWAFFRRTQVHLLACLEEYGRHGVGATFSERTGRGRREIENEVADLDYRILALLAGGLATGDKASARSFRLLAPHGRLVLGGGAAASPAGQPELAQAQSDRQPGAKTE